MADALARIIARKRGEIATRSFADACPKPSTRSLRAALERPGARFILEIKKRSPSGHVGRHRLADAVAAYRPVADAISVLTDGPDFGGSLEDLRAVRVIYDGPILAKDFIVDPRQVGEARAAGADAVLAMLSVLDDPTAAEVMAAAARLAMDVIVEVHDRSELDRAAALGAAIIGINNRDFSTLATDLGRTEVLAPHAPAGTLLISESGIQSRVDVIRLAPRVDAFLVGSALMAAADIGEAARALVHGRVKLCGLTHEDDVALAADAGATHAGFIFVPDSPRAVSAGAAAPLAALAHDAGLKPVGVFRNAPVEHVAALSRKLGLAAIQLHGGESETTIARLRRLLPPQTEIWAACAVGPGPLSEPQGADRLLFDTLGERGFGGSGTAFDWSRVEGRPSLADSFLAGGIGPANAAAAAAIGAHGIDIGSSIERQPGRKDPDKVEALFAALRPSSRRMS